MEQINSLRVATEAHRIDEKIIIGTHDETPMTDVVTSIEQIKAILQEIKKQSAKQEDKLIRISEISENDRYISEFTKIKDLLETLFSNQKIFNDISTSQKKIETRVSELVEVTSIVEQNLSIESKKSSPLTKKSEINKLAIPEEKLFERFEKRLNDYHKSITNELKNLNNSSGTSLEKMLEQLPKEFERILSERIPKGENFTNQYKEEISNCIVSLKTIIRDIETVLQNVKNTSKTHLEGQQKIEKKSSRPDLSILTNRNKKIELVIVVDGSDSFSNKSRYIL